MTHLNSKSDLALFFQMALASVDPNFYLVQTEPGYFIVRDDSTDTEYAVEVTELAPLPPDAA